LGPVQGGHQDAPCACRSYQIEDSGVPGSEAGFYVVYEYRDKFTQLSRYCPNEVEKDEDKQDHFLEGLNDGLSYTVSNVKYDNFQEMVDRALMLESKHRKMEEKKRKFSSF